MQSVFSDNTVQTHCPSRPSIKVILEALHACSAEVSAIAHNSIYCHTTVVSRSDCTSIVSRRR